MATFLDPTGAVHPLRCDHRIGRHRDCQLVLAEHDASRQHAVVRFQGGRWLLRDLGSRNGSFLNGERLEPGLERALEVGDALRFGTSELWTVRDLAPPESAAALIDGGPTVDRDGRSPVSLRFEVSRDEEHVELSLLRGAEVVPLGSRVHHYTLLVLARQREADARAGLAEAEQGWLAQADLERMLRVDRNVVYQHLYRARRELGQHLLDPGLEIIERRPDAGQLRIGLGVAEVRAIGGEGSRLR